MITALGMFFCSIFLESCRHRNNFNARMQNIAYSNPIKKSLFQVRLFDYFLFGADRCKSNMLFFFSGRLYQISCLQNTITAYSVNIGSTGKCDIFKMHTITLYQMLLPVVFRAYCDLSSGGFLDTDNDIKCLITPYYRRYYSVSITLRRLSY